MAKRATKAQNGTNNANRSGPRRGDPGLPTTSLSSPYQMPTVNVTFSPSGRGIVLGTGADWFGPLNPMLPTAPPQVAGRVLDYPSGYNLVQRPRAYEPLGFQDLRNLAETYDILRLVIETRKDQMERMKWTIRPKNEKKAGTQDATAKKLIDFFQRPDSENDWSAWLRMLLEDLFVIDAPALYKERTRSGDLIALRPIDGANIKRVIDDWGRTPQPYIDETGSLVVPPAYQHVLKQMPAVDYAADDLVYRPRNPRTNKIYGYSPVEQIVMTVNIGLRRQISTLQYFTEGNIPEALIGVPDNWTPAQIIDFQTAWDLMMEGNTAQRRHAKFVPGGVAKGFVQTREPELKGPQDEWLARVTCFAFSISPQPFVIQMNRATAQTAQEAALEEGLEPTMLWAKGMIDKVIANDFGAPGYEFVFVEDTEIDPEKQTTILTKRLEDGIITLDEARADLGMDAYGIKGVTDVPMVKTASGFLLIDEESVKKPPPPAPFGGGDGTEPPKLGPDGKPLPPKPGAGKEPVPAKGKGDEPGAKKLAADARRTTLAPVSNERPALVEARARYEKKAGEILARVLKEVRSQLPAALEDDASHKHEPGE